MAPPPSGFHCLRAEPAQGDEEQEVRLLLHQSLGRALSAGLIDCRIGNDQVGTQALESGEDGFVLASNGGRVEFPDGQYGDGEHVIHYNCVAGGEGCAC